jgi:type II secretory pathway pseudopilin PulG
MDVAACAGRTGRPCEWRSEWVDASRGRNSEHEFGGGLSIGADAPSGEGDGGRSGACGGGGAVNIEVWSPGFSPQRVESLSGLRAKARTPNLSAFTLIEVILAVVIASGLLVVAISYYQRSADLRSQLLEESERLTTMRLMMDRLSGDLRTAFAEPRQGFSGTPDSMRFVHVGNPTPGNLGEGALKLVSYSVATNSQGTNAAVVIGFNRVETPLVELRTTSATTNSEPLSFNGAMDPTVALTNQVVEPMTRAIRFVRFRYFNGSEWMDSWDGVDLPRGVEATFGTEPVLPDDEVFGGEQFMRVIFVPAGRASSDWEELP